jgi:hypothetical protein
MGASSRGLTTNSGTVETNHLMLSMILFDCVAVICSTLSAKDEISDEFGDNSYTWMVRAAKDARELILARRCLVKLIEADRVDHTACIKVRDRVAKLVEPYDIVLAEGGLTSPVLKLKLPQGWSNEPDGKLWAVPR